MAEPCIFCGYDGPNPYHGHNGGELSELKKLRVAGVAIRWNDGPHEGKVWTLPPPARHRDLIPIVFAATNMRVPSDWMGFLLSDGRYTSRKAAYYIAEQAGQIKNGKLIGSVLTSEDLW